METDLERRDMMARRFRELYGGEPALWCRAPGRVDLMGSHTDYNLGLVLTMPIGLEAWIAARPRGDREVRLRSLDLEADGRFALDLLVPSASQPWSNYVIGVARVLADEGLPLTGFDGLLRSTIPIGSGLSSSAALECVTATIFEALGGWALDPVRKAVLCQKAENSFVGVNCGILDQYTSCLGKEGCALLLDCRDLSGSAVEIAGDIRVVVCDTRSKRELAGSEYGRRRAQCEEGARRLGLAALRDIAPGDYGRREAELPPEVAKRCRFIVEENDRVPRMADALRTGDRAAIRALAAASFRGACDLYEIGAPPMHAMMAAMLGAPGAIGARQAGAGFGGCMAAFVERDRVEEFADGVRRGYAASTGIEPRVHAVDAVHGAGRVHSNHDRGGRGSR